MIKLCSKVLLLLILIAFLSELAWKTLPLPYYWGNIQLNTKLNYLEEQNIDPTNYFIGSSVTFRQVIPTVFDSIVGKSMGYSFNLGCDMLFAPQTYMLLEELLKRDTSIQYLFVELNSHDFFGQNFRTTRSKYYLTAGWLATFYPYIGETSVSLMTKLGISGMYLYNYFEKLLGLGMREAVLKQIHEKNIFKGKVLLGEYGDGYYRLPSSATTDTKEIEKLPTQLKEIQMNYTEAHQMNNTEPYNEVLKKQLEKYILLAEEKNTCVIFILNPVSSIFDTEKEMVALYRSLPEKNRINLADPKENSDFFLVENRWDKGHLNHKGARIYSEKLAQSFLNLVAKK